MNNKNNNNKFKTKTTIIAVSDASGGEALRPFPREPKTPMTGTGRKLTHPYNKQERPKKNGNWKHPKVGTRNTVFRREPKTPTTGTEKTKGNWKNPRQELKNQIQEKKSAGKGKTHSGNQKNPTQVFLFHIFPSAVVATLTSPHG